MAAFSAGFVVLAAGVAMAHGGQPEPWQMGFQPAASPVMSDIQSFHNLLLTIILLIAGLVLTLMMYTVWRFSAKRNPEPSRTSHNTVIEVIWTVVPIMVLIVIAIPSFKLLYFQDRTTDAELTIKAIGHQWYWSYEYPDHDGLAFDSIMLEEEELASHQPRLLATDTNVVVPVDTNIRLLVTASDVIHAWAIPAFGVKTDAVPGRVNETWFRAEHEGLFYGQCSELCGIRHGYMPIAVEVVSKDAFADWLVKAKKEFASRRDDVPRLADAQGAAAE